MRIGLAGYTGYWGKKLARVLGELGHKIVAQIDLDHPPRWDKIKADAVIIATPPDTHYELAMGAMSAGLDVLVEKPMAMQADQAVDMAEYALDHNRVLSVDSTFLHTAAFKFLLNLDEPLTNYQSIRLAPPMPQAVIPPSWDLIVHDLSILHRLQALGDGVGIEDGDNWAVAHAALSLPTGGFAFIMASRAWPMKERSVTLYFPSGAYFWTLNSLQAFTPGGMSMELETVVEEKEEPLKRLIKDFEWRCCERAIEGLTDGNHGAEVCGRLERLFPRDTLCQSQSSRVGGNGLHRITAM